jgi:osmoprotectant transport system ATP-binding protein
MKKENEIEFREVSFSYGQNRVLQDISLEIKKGEFMVIVGPSGGGKTSMLKLINGMIFQDSGEVIIRGKNRIDWDTVDLRRKTGYVIQEGGLFPHMSVSENIAYPLRILGEDRSTGRKRAEKLSG